jgi:hypothetical protein
MIQRHSEKELIALAKQFKAVAVTDLDSREKLR